METSHAQCDIADDRYQSYMIAPDLAHLVSSAIALCFAPEDRGSVRDLLAEYTGNEPERVQLAILVLADGDTSALLDMVRAAHLDYRDVLYWAEYPEESQTGRMRAEMAARYAKFGAPVPPALG